MKKKGRSRVVEYMEEVCIGLEDEIQRIKPVSERSSRSSGRNSYKSLSKALGDIEDSRSFFETYKENKEKLNKEIEELSTTEAEFRQEFEDTEIIQLRLRNRLVKTNNILRETLESTSRPSEYVSNIDEVHDGMRKMLDEIRTFQPKKEFNESERTQVENVEILYPHIETVIQEEKRNSLGSNRPRALSDVSTTSSSMSSPSPIITSIPQVNFGELLEDLDLTKSCLGIGRYGRVYRVHIKNGEIDGIDGDEYYAIKLVSETSEKSLKQEIELVQSLYHPNIVNVLAWCPSLLAGEKYMGYMMPFCDRGSLMNIIRNIEKKGRIMKFESVVGFVYQTAKGMEYVHKNKIIHYDIKWSNVIIDGKNQNIVKISDFGLSKRVSRRDFLSFVRGASYYISPEVYYLKKITNKCDVYAFGIMLFEILVCTIDPFNVRNSGQIKTVMRMASLNRRYRPDLKSFPRFVYKKDVHEKYVELMKSCWDHNYKERPSFEEIVQYLETHYPRFTKKVADRLYSEM